MSITKIRNKLTEFLSTTTPEVVAIKGAWGVGKTYTWSKFSLEAKENEKIALKKYSYVSLFGINSLETFKAAIFENILSTKLIGTAADIDSFNQNTQDMLSHLGKKTWSIFSDVPLLKGFSSTINSLSFMTIKDTIICIDDLERRGNNLQLKEVLGLISMLKEQRKCKVVILVNEGELGIEDYAKYREKVIDSEFEFSPTAYECASIAFPSTWTVKDATTTCSTKLDIKNIRLLKKIEKMISEAENYWLGKEPEIREQFIQSLVLFCFSHYEHLQNKTVPPLEFILKQGHSISVLGAKDADSAEIKKKRNFLNDYGYYQTDELDLKLSEAVVKGYFEEDEIKKLVENKNAQIIASKSANSFSSAWNLFHNTFANNQDELVNSLLTSLARNAKNITPTNLNGTVCLFRELGLNVEATKAIDIYVENRKQESSLFDLTKLNFFGDKIDPEIEVRFNNHFVANEKKENIKDIVLKISEQKSWSPKDVILLSNTSMEQFYDLFMTEEGDHLHEMVRACLQFGEFTNASPMQLAIAANVKAALAKISNESLINKIRIKKYGIGPE